MSAGGEKAQGSQTPYLLSGDALDAFVRLAQPQPFKAGEWIAAPGRPLMGWYLIESGTVVTADDAVADLARRGLVLERHDMFGEYSLVPGADPFPSVLRALTSVETKFLKAEIFPSLLQRAPHLDKLVQDRVTLNTHLAAFTAALKRYPALKDVPLYQLIKIAQRGTVTTYDVDKSLEDKQANRILFVARGEVIVDDCVVLQAGSIFRIVGSRKDRVKEGTCLIELDWANIRKSVPNYVRLSTRMERELKMVPPATKRPVTVRLASEADDTPISALCVLLMETLQRDQPRDHDTAFSSVVVRVYADKAARDAGELADEPLARRLAHIGGGFRWVLRREIKNLWKGDEHVPDVAFVDDTPFRGSPDLKALIKELNPAKLLYFVRDTWEVPDEMKTPTMSIVRCVFLRGGDVGQFKSSSEPGSLFVAAYHPGTVRLRFDDLHALEGKAYRDLSVRDQFSLSRCGRAIMERRVGLALGGGAAWGYAHIALIEALEEVKLPIDLVSGVSFGSLAGGFYAAGGLPLLYELVPRGTKLQLALLLSSMVPPLVHQYLTALLEDRLLQYLETPFFPVGLNLETGEEWSPAVGPVSHGIRASSMLPGMFSPMITDGVRSVDGVFVNNVPEGVLTRECADFIIASDVMQTPGDPYAQPPRWASSVFRRAWKTFKSVSPISRMRDNMDATAFLTKIADERDKGLANVRFEPGRTGIAMWDFSKGNQIIEMARRQAQKFARDAYDAWIKLPTLRMSS
jgi:NTE family protein